MERVQESERRWLAGGVSGAVGSQNAFVELAGLEKADLLEQRVMSRLGIRKAANSYHGRIDRFSEITCNLANICTSLSKMGLNLRSWQSAEIGEISFEESPQKHSSSTMPNKSNAETIEHVEGIAIMVRSYATAVQSIQMRDIRDSSRIPVLYTAIPQALMMGSRAVVSMNHILEHIRVDEKKMLSNVYHPNVLGQAAAERLMIALYKKCGRRQEVHEKLHQCARKASALGIPFREMVLSDKTLRPHFTGAELDGLFDLQTYFGNAVVRTEKTLKALSKTDRD
jgi:adenylosuccinate lyase